MLEKTATLETVQTAKETGFLKIHSIESFGTFDGPGIRFVVFLQGCPFQCLYCSNPDTMEFKNGQDFAIDDLVDKAIRMKPYFINGGGVTVSGGEPCMQAKSLIPFFKELKKNGIHTAIDTNGYVFNHYVKELLDYTDLVLLDVKHINSEIHQKITSRRNEKTLETATYLREINQPTWLRYVLVPGLSDQPAYLHEFGQYFKEFDNIEKLEIQPYHTLGAHKWELLGKEYQLADTPENTRAQLTEAHRIFSMYFDDVVIN